MWYSQYFPYIVLTGLIGPFIWWTIWGFIGEFPNKRERVIWLMVGAYAQMAMIFLVMYVQH